MKNTIEKALQRQQEEKQAKEVFFSFRGVSYFRDGGGRAGFLFVFHAELKTFGPCLEI